MKLDRNSMTLLGMGFKIPGVGLVPLGVLPGLLGFSASFRLFTSVRAGWLVFVAAFWALVSGLITRLAGPSSEIDVAGLIGGVTSVIWLVMLVLVGITVVRPIQAVGVNSSLIILGISMAVGTYLLVRPGNFAWKYALGYGLAIFILGLAARRSFGLTIFFGIALSVFSLFMGARSIGLIVAFSVLAAVIARLRVSGKGIGPGLIVGSAVSFAGLVAIILHAMRNGWLGEKLQASYIEQTTGDQFILLGGRSEWRAAWDLFLSNPWGYGIGGQPSSEAKRSAIFAATEYRGSYFDPYFTRAVFGSRVDLHSAVTNLWFHFGVGGLILAIAILILLIRGVLLSLSVTPGLAAPIVFILTFGIWDLLFSPMMQYDHIGLAIGVAIFLECHGRAGAERRNSVLAGAGHEVSKSRKKRMSA